MLVTALAATAIVAGTGTAGDTKGPPCVNVIDSTQGYVYDEINDSGEVEVNLILAAPACDAADYLLDIYDYLGSPQLANDLVPTIISGNTVTFRYSFAAGTAPNDGVCFVAETFFRDRLADRAPDSGCFQVPANEAPGGQGAS
jgi:hypothetical protein